MQNEFLRDSNLENIEKYLPPYEYNVDFNIVNLSNNKLLSIMVIDGMPFESQSDVSIKNSFVDNKEYLIALGQEYGGKLAIWTHMVKKEVKLEDEYHFKSKFMTDFSKDYCNTFSNGAFYKTEYYISFVLQSDDIHEGKSKLNAINTQALSVFKSYNATMLGVSQYASDGVFMCPNNSFLSYLINNDEVQYPLTDTPITESITNSDWFSGFDVTEIRNRESLDSKFAVCYLLKSLPKRTRNGMWDFLLSLPFEFIVSQSFIFTSNGRSMKMISSQKNKLKSVKDAAIQEVEELELGESLLASGEAQFGDYHASMVVFGNTPKKAIDNGVEISSQFLTAGKGTKWTKINLDSIYAFTSMMPGSKYRPLSTMRSSTNLACGFSLHNFSYGKRNGNPIGDGSAIMPVKTRSDGLFYLNTHYSNPRKNVLGEKIAGHALILGATGAGKTTLEGTMTGFLQRFDPMMFVIDYNRSTELFVRAYGGSYYTLKEGEYTGFNPFQLEENPTNEIRLFIYQLVTRCAIAADGSITETDQKVIEKAVDAVLSMPLEERRFAMIMQSIPHGGELRLRLENWCNGGKYAWALDSEKNTFNPRDYSKVGFDTTVILEKDQSGKVHRASEPLLSTLLFYKKLMQRDGRLMLTIVEEFWIPCNFPTTQDLIKGILKAGRLKGEFIWLVSQSPEDAINCEIFAAIVQQTPTKIFLPNPDANSNAGWESYSKVGLTKKEFNELVKLKLESRMFLIKQSNSSCFAKMDLSASSNEENNIFDKYLWIISGTTENIVLCEKIRKELNTENPDLWIPELQKRILENRTV
ncbi:TriC protein [Yersinia aldovae]|uniref:VirB4 family type IV secretion/conjugal transfer ATPase n=1 Tax=Yersinia aldovae TaxID=29483 RepID=UPI0005EA0F80|nr:VirB4 family type IV secretion system protein [Yersinia aldovae]CNK25774.1 TriC protein [Yersinia aldovae]